MRVGACQTPEILDDIDAAPRITHDFAEQADAPAVDLLLFLECFLQRYLVLHPLIRMNARSRRLRCAPGAGGRRAPSTADQCIVGVVAP
ncbi:hypothetical protein [Actinoplanes sp. N902-109]|uniref:hypothetical protein n=1 Tax=Actinoplanes sp. (strain N902-109) TaxID=649831 RepID=UPI0003295E4E|nr:hypothetical protein [Actinoplanes sp. N902-109]AGL18620.1 nitrilase/cyanide hydratase and apolipoprotein n-acyltransferase [Actinoplanes sp. N902-109]